MVGVQIQEHRNPGSEGRGELELKTGDLDHMNRFRCRVFDLRAQRRADIAADQRRPPPCLQHPPKQHRRCRLALRAGDRHDPAAQPSRRQLDLTDDGRTVIPSHIQHRQRRGYPGTEHDEVSARHRVRVVAAQFQLDAVVRQAPDLGGNFAALFC